MLQCDGILQTEIKYPYCFPEGVTTENGLNQERENFPKTACIDFHLDFFTQRASSFFKDSIPVSSFQMAETWVPNMIDVNNPKSNP